MREIRPSVACELLDGCGEYMYDSALTRFSRVLSWFQERVRNIKIVTKLANCFSVKYSGILNSVRDCPI